MNKKKCLMFSLIVMFLNTTVSPVGVGSSLRRLRQWIAHKPIACTVARSEGQEPIVIPAPNVEHKKRSVLFINNMPEFFDILKEDPKYVDMPHLIDQTISVNGQALTPGSSADIMIEDGKGVVTIKLYKGFAKLIYAMEQGFMRGILMKLLKRIDPLIQWQYSVTFTINEDIEFVQLSDLVLTAYNRSLDDRAVNHRFKWILVVDLSLNETVDL